jgi:hypothetical protein
MEAPKLQTAYMPMIYQKKPILGLFFQNPNNQKPETGAVLELPTDVWSQNDYRRRPFPVNTNFGGEFSTINDRLPVSRNVI